jgi:hypothetical protein
LNRQLVTVAEIKHRNVNMIWLTPHQITPPITALFDITQPTLPRAFDVLEDITGGQIVVDDLKSAWAGA